MFIHFEEYAAAQMLCQPDSPPRSQGKLYFSEDWQRTVYGMAMALSRDGHFEWEDFRQELIAAIAAWEAGACGGSQTPWDYYACYTTALIKVLERHSLLQPGELEPLLQTLREVGARAPAQPAA
ncbi:MAG TPA: nitrile hydratase accessory protein [Janthinobacterium sp.]|jgi:nitrile hydratase accessory protein|nr:nitrile hydratase accessory protein [Janthinobacterium sp.]